MKRATALLLLVFILVLPMIQSNSKSELASSYHPRSANPVVPNRLASSVGNSVPISSCGVLDSPGTTYVLSNDIRGGGGIGEPNACILITQNGITLNLNGFRVESNINGIIVKASHDEVKGPGTIASFGIGNGLTIVNGSNNKVHDVSVSYGFVGIHVFNSNNNLITNNNITNIGFFGISVFNSTGNILSGNTITESGTILPLILMGAGIALQTASQTVVVRNKADGNGNGIFIDEKSGRTLVAFNQFSNNNQSGIVSFAGSSTILGNLADDNGINGISVAASSNILGFNTADNNAERGIGLGNLCSGITTATSSPSGNNNRIIGNTAQGNSIDYFWDSQGTGNLWAFNQNDNQSIPLTPPTAPLQC